MSQRVLLWLLTAALVVLALPRFAVAQGQPVRPVVVDPATAPGRQAPAADPHAGHGHDDTIKVGPGADQPDAPKDRDRREGAGGAMALLFWLFAAITIGGSIFVITRRNLIAAVMGMVGTFFGVAALYMMLYANFLAVIQMLVYAGAIMVLFVFVVMILNKPEDEPYGKVGLPGKALAALAMLYLTFRLGQTLWDVKPPESAQAAPPPVQIVTAVSKDEQGRLVPTMESHNFGSTGAVGSNLFDEYLFPFEAVSILLLVAVVGAIAIARPLKNDDEDEAAALDAEAQS